LGWQSWRTLRDLSDHINSQTPSRKADLYPSTKQDLGGTSAVAEAVKSTGALLVVGNLGCPLNAWWVMDRLPEQPIQC